MTDGPNVAQATRIGEVYADTQNLGGKKPNRNAGSIRLTPRMERWPRFYQTLTLEKMGDSPSVSRSRCGP